MGAAGCSGEEALASDNLPKKTSKAYVVIDTAPAAEHDVYEELKKDVGKDSLPRLERVDMVFGNSHDLICIIEGSNLKEVGEYATNLRRKRGVIDTSMMTVLPGAS